MSTGRSMTITLSAGRATTPGAVMDSSFCE
jgi:hypothetical protein